MLSERRHCFKKKIPSLHGVGRYKFNLGSNFFVVPSLCVCVYGLCCLKVEGLGYSVEVVPRLHTHVGLV